ncbi:MAG: hypothetical protein D6688_11615 [Alphaproteobacteria bacterium]|nr:MAG: hypothetical protein D6688_11615 [Alphaproteobacteria bacterium]
MWPKHQALRLGATEFELRAEDMRASVVLGLASGTPLRRAVAVVRDAALDGGTLPIDGAAAARAAIR